MDKKLGLFRLLHGSGSEVRRGHRGPIDLIQVVQAGSKPGINCPRVRQAEGPTPVYALGPCDHFVQIGFEMHDGTLTIAVSKLRVVCAMDNKQHYRPWAEIEGHIISHDVTGVTIHGQS